MNRSATLRLALLALSALAAISSNVLPVQAQDTPAGEVVEYKGTVAPSLQAAVSPRIDGLLTEIRLTAGQSVKKGDLLFEFGSRDKELSVALGQARLEQAEADLRLAETTLNTAKNLRTKNVASEMQYLQAEARRDVAAAKVKEARANLQLAELALEQMRLYAPISGIVSPPLISIGEYITRESREHSELATIAQLDPVHVIGRVPASAYFERGTTVTSIEQAAHQREFGLVLPTGDVYPHQGRFVAGSYAFDPTTQMAEVTIEFPNPDLLLRPGLNVILRSTAHKQ